MRKVIIIIIKLIIIFRDNFVPGAWDIISGIQQRIEITEYKDNFVELQVQIIYKGKMREFLKPFL